MSIITYNGNILIYNNYIVDITKPPTVTDYDGNVYTIITIGTQEWLGENLKTTHYSDGTPIPNLTADEDWEVDSSGAYCWYDNDIGYKNPYGALYNWYAVNNAHGLAYFEKDGIQDEGWRIPTKDDWETLVSYLGGSDVAGGKLKETGFEHWESPNTDATNESGFTALPGGSRYFEGQFTVMGENGYYWASTEYNETFSYHYLLYNINGTIARAIYYKENGYSVRCIKDI